MLRTSDGGTMRVGGRGNEDEDLIAAKSRGGARIRIWVADMRRVVGRWFGNPRLQRTILVGFLLFSFFFYLFFFYSTFFYSPLFFLPLLGGRGASLLGRGGIATAFSVDGVDEQVPISMIPRYQSRREN